MFRLQAVEKYVLAGVLFTLLLLLLRMHYSHTGAYWFYCWNLLLAVIPLFLGRRLYRTGKCSFKAMALFIGWLLFFPNTAYLVTDILHFTERPPVPLWFDILLVSSAAWNGLLLFIVSLLQTEKWLVQYTIFRRFPFTGMLMLLMLCAYGIYLGRFLRFNSWDVLITPCNLLHTCIGQVIHPFYNREAWAFTFLFGWFLGLAYFTIKKLPGLR